MHVPDYDTTKLLTYAAIAGIFENLVAVNSKYSEQVVQKTELIPWLLKWINTKVYDSNRGYACELISIFLQESRGISSHT